MILSLYSLYYNGVIKSLKPFRGNCTKTRPAVDEFDRLRSNYFVRRCFKDGSNKFQTFLQYCRKPIVGERCKMSNDLKDILVITLLDELDLRFSVEHECGNKCTRLSAWKNEARFSSPLRFISPKKEP